MIYVGALATLFGVTLAGCHGLAVQNPTPQTDTASVIPPTPQNPQQYENQNPIDKIGQNAKGAEEVLRSAEPVAQALAPATGGISYMVWLILSNIATGTVAIVEGIKRKNREDAMNTAHAISPTGITITLPEGSKARQVFEKVSGI